MRTIFKIILTLIFLFLLADLALVAYRIYGYRQDTPKTAEESEDPIEVSPPVECNALCEQSCQDFPAPEDTAKCIEECQLICGQTVSNI